MLSEAHGDEVVAHFTARAAHYNASAKWCADDEVMRLTQEVVQTAPDDRVLDVACGTGLVSRAFRGRVGSVVGLDLTPAMGVQARPYLDELVIGSAEHMPFRSRMFDIAICRQGIQFVDAPRVVREMARVTGPGGQVVLINLCAYGPEDRDECFEIQRLRNPARRNFFVKDDLVALLRDAGYKDVAVHEHVSAEDVEVWADNGAIARERCERIRAQYDQASPAFRGLHKVEYVGDGRVVDHMLFVFAVGTA
jgi:DNA gyrase subunit B